MDGEHAMSQFSINPFEAADTDDYLSDDRARTEPPGEILFRWERMRIVYNLILGAVYLTVLAIAPLTSGLSLRQLEEAVGGGLVCCFLANVCYSVGPIAEFYLWRLGFSHRFYGRGLFVVGTMFSMFLALIATLAFVGGLIPDPDAVGVGGID